MSIVEIKNLNKTYPSFVLSDVSFEIEEGRIMGFIGKNGAGKTTTIKSMLNLIHPDRGEITYFGKSLYENEKVIKSSIGYLTGSVNWYPRKKLKDIIDVVKDFYDTWDDETYKRYLSFFELDENKCVFELSEGMKVKFNLLIALSHDAKVLILDEPTSGLDPFSRDELLDVFIKLKNKGISVFFSTHIISDVEKCADDILYISDGKILASMPKENFLQEFGNDNESLEEIILRIEKENNNAKIAKKRI